MTMDYPPIIFFDMEGTLLLKEYRLDDGLVAPSAWTVLAEALGADCLAAENETKRIWREGGFSCYLEWMRKTIEIHKAYGLTRETFEHVMDSVRLTPNAGPALLRIHAAGAITVLVTGGFKALADRVQRLLRIHHVFAGCEYFFAPDGSIDHFNLLPADEQGKVDFMELICREYRIDPKRCAFVGDGMNDVHLAKAVGFSIAFNAQRELEAVSSRTVRQGPKNEDLMVVADILEHAQGRQ